MHGVAKGMHIEGRGLLLRLGSVAGFAQNRREIEKYLWDGGWEYRGMISREAIEKKALMSQGHLYEVFAR